MGALVVLVAVQLSVLGLYRPPVLKRLLPFSAPDDHFTVCPDDRVTHRAEGVSVVLVAVQLFVLGLYRPPVLKRLLPLSAPDDHLTACPDGRVTVPGRGRVGGAGGSPTIRVGIVSPASVEIVVVLPS